MKLHTEQREITSSGLTNTKKTFGISQNSKMFRILSDQMYSDKPGAIIRELGCNAWDSHVAAGKTDVPFEVHLPTMLEPWLSIVDQGIGLSHNDVMNLYTTYGESTKNNSNDFIGALGLGSKSPFAYTDTFTITSVFGSEIRMYNAFINETGEPTITMVGGVGSSNKPNGISIQVPVKPEDHRKFAEAVTTYYPYFPTAPKITGANVTLSQPEYTLSGLGWAMTEQASYSSSKHVALMGNVPYPIDISKIVGNDGLRSDFLNSVAYFNVRMDFELGELDIAASREALSYDKGTIAAIKTKYRTIQQELKNTFVSELANCPSLYEACIKYTKSYKIRKMVLGDYEEVLWRGKRVGTNVHVDLNKQGIGVVTVKHIHSPQLRNRKTLNLSGITNSTFSVKTSIPTNTDNNLSFPITSNKLIVITKDTGIKAVRMPSRLMAAYKAEAFGPLAYGDPAIDVVLLEGKEDDINKVLKYIGNVPNVHNFFDVCPDVTPSGSSTAKSNKKKATRVLEFHHANVSSMWASAKDVWSEVVDPVILDDSKGYYVDTRSFKPHFMGSDGELQYLSNLSLSSLIGSINKTSLFETDYKMYGIPGSYKNLMRDHGNWECIIEAVITKLNKFGTSQRYRDIKLDNQYSTFYQEYYSLFNLLKNLTTNDPEFNSLIKLVNNVEKGRQEYEAILRIQATLNSLSNLPLKLRLDTLPDKRYTTEVFDRYPMLHYVSTIGKQKKGANIVDYINTLHELNKGDTK